MKNLIGAALLVLLSASCSGGGGGSAGFGPPLQIKKPINFVSSSGEEHHHRAGAGAQKTKRIYILEPTTIPIFPLHSSTPSFTIQFPGSKALDIALSDAGNLYVSQPAGNIVAEYSAEGNKRLATLSGTPRPGELAIDSAGNLYAVSGNAFDGIYVYAPGSTTPSYEISNSRSGIPRCLTFDGANNVYLTEGPASDASIIEFPPGSTMPKLNFAVSGFVAPTAMVADAAGQLYVGSQGGVAIQGVAVFAPGTANLSYVITNGSPLPVALALDRNGNLYVANYDFFFGSGGTIAVYAPGTTTPKYTITTPGDGTAEPLSLAIDSSGNLYVAYAGFGVHEYAAGTVNPIRTVDADPNPSVVLVGR